MMKMKKRHLVILMTLAACLMGLAGKAWAQDEPSRANWNLETTGSFELAGNKDLTGTISLTGDLTLTVTTNNARTIKRVKKDGNNWNGPLFLTNGYKLTIRGYSDAKRVTIDCGTVFTGDDARNYTGSTSQTVVGQGSAIYVNNNGGLELQNVTLQNCYCYKYCGDYNAVNPNDNVKGQGWGLLTIANKTDNAKTLTLTNVTLRNGFSGYAGAGIYFRGADNHGTATFTNVTITQCYSYGASWNGESSGGGTIRTNGSLLTSLVLDNCHITNNKSGGGSNTGSGAGIYWNGAGSATTHIELRGGTEISGNVAASSGGGIFIESRLTLTNATISNNTATNGGGIYFCTYGGGAKAFDGNPFNATISSGVTISGNHATNAGGGLYLAINKSSDIGYNASGTALQEVEFKLTVNGGTITGNHAPLGGGVAIFDCAPKKVRYPINTVTHGTNTSTDLRESGEYKRTVSISAGSVYNNYTDGGSNYGGGFYIKKYKDSSIAETGTGTNVFSYQAVGGAGTMNITLSGGNVYHNGINGTATTPTTAYGGAMFITDDMGNVSPYLSQCNVSVSGGSIYQNQCTTNGGAIYVNNGVFSMSAGTIGGSTANANKSTGGNGGGFFITGAYSKVTVSGGNITYNTATAGNGGGFYVNNSSSDGTTISGSAQVKYNQAKNGAGAFVNAGKLNVNGSGVAVSNNTASASGGGVYVNGGTVGVTSATIASNTAATHGGGIYSSSGAVTLSSAKINSNTATDGNGGGVYAGSSVTVTSATLTGNKATNASNGMGGGIYATGTNTTVSVDGTSSAKSLLTNNQARLGGGVYAAAKSVTVGYATIGNDGARNTASADGGGIYAAGPVTLNTGALIQCNTAASNGGGVYVNNGTFTMNAGTIGGSSATYANVATNGNGGGIYITGSSAKVEIKGGLIGYNSAPATSSGNGNGGGIYVASTGTDGTAISGGASVSNNTAKQNGGGVYVVSGKVSLVGSSSTVLTSISNNIAQTTNGGGVYLGGGQFILGGYSTIVGNQANSGNGGGVYVGGTSPIYRQQSDSEYLGANAYTEVKQNTANNGAGIYMDGGICYVSAGYVHDNDATTNGGGIFMNGGTFTHSGGEIGKLSSAPNTAVNGAGLYMNGGTYTSSGGYFNGNTASDKGGGIYMNGGKCEFTGGKLGFNTTTMRNTAVYGGGLYMASSAKANPEFYMKSSDSYIRGNQATTNGGAIYMENGTCEISAGNIGDSDNPNNATNGGGIYANGGTITVKGGYVQYNTATESGGGIYANSGLVEVNYANASDGSIRYNYAELYGGGLYISASGHLNLKGKATLTKNHVPLGSLGGGVYLLGTVQAGASATDIITVVDNFAANTSDPASYTPVPATRNNIYLPSPVDTQTTDVITIVTNGLDLTQSKVGFSVPGNFLPVIYCSDNSYLNTNQNAIITAVFEDSERYDARYFSSSATYSPYYIYLAADTWVQAVTSRPEGFVEDGSGNVTISSNAGLAWLISKVNGLNGQTGNDYSGKTVTVDADIDMSENAWVPIGMTGNTSPNSFKGTFDGGGHVIAGIDCSYLGEGNTGTGSSMGLFGNVSDAVIHDVFVHGEILTVMAGSSSQTFNLGGIAASGTATIYNCTADATMTSINTATTMGGIIGSLSSGGTIHSSAAMPVMTGYTMGGLAGTNAGSIYNSFANPKFTYSGTGNEYVGGLVAENSGTIENCYVRFSQPSSLGGAKFGQLTGSNTGGVTVCYNPTNYASGIGSALTNSGSVASTAYGDVVAPYLYNHGNDNLVGATGQTLCKKLNDWVNEHPGYGYATWKRTTAGGYSATAGNINGDYPIHQLTDYVCAASPDGVFIDYANTLDDMLDRHTSYATVNLYADQTGVTGSTGTGVVVYIDEDVNILQGNTTSSIAAYTCQTLKSYTRGERWHYVSSSLRQSGIGFVYGNTTQVPFSWATNPCSVTFSQNDDAALFPSDVLGITSVDLYAFYEPEYHWINLKRNTDSHWHMNAHDVQIHYNGNGTGGNGNETYLIPGKGYLASIDQEQLLQNSGTLNNGDVTVQDVTKTDFNAWAGLLGYNLLGNPYQSYLDFSEFTRVNGGLFTAKDEAEVTYATYDPKYDAFVQYKSGSSVGSKAAGVYIHSHQGFIIQKTATDDGTNTRVTFTNAMRSTAGTTAFRGEQPAYPLVNLTLTDGTGVVHIAPAFGEDDNRVGKVWDLPFLQLVNTSGHMCGGTPWDGLFVKDADKPILKALEENGKLFAALPFEHSYPFCWRCDTPLIYYARESWFIKMTAVKDKLIAFNKSVNWIPETIGEGRMGNFLENVIDWGISRERYWGTPLPVWMCECGHVHVIGSRAELKAMSRNCPDDIELHKPYIDAVEVVCPKCGKIMKREPVVIDCWFDSGSMPFAQWHYPFENKEEFERRYPAAFISEAVDQTRGWFYTLMAVAACLFDKAPFENCLVLGLVCDKDGKKMSKHIGNVIAPADVLEKQGADAVRWYFYTASAPWLPSRFSGEAVSEYQRKFMSTLWNTYAFYVLYADIDGFDPTKHALKRENLTLMDRWILSRLQTLTERVDGNLAEFRITEAGRELTDFADELSNWYVRRCRDRYWGGGMEEDKVNAYMTLFEALCTVSLLAAPMVPFMTEAIWQNIVRPVLPGAEESIHLCSYPAADESLIDPALEADMDHAIRLVEMGRAARNAAAIKNRQPLSRMLVKAPFTLSEYYDEIIAEELNVKRLEYTQDAEGFISYSFKPQMRTLGPRFGRQLNEIRTLLQNLDGAAAMRELKETGFLTLQLSGGEAKLTQEDLLIDTAQKEGFSAQQDGGITVVLDTVLTQELIEEGFVREIISKVQTMRKEAGFEVMDRILLYHEGSAKLEEIFGKYEGKIRKEVLANAIVRGAGDGYRKDWNINGEAVTLAVKKEA